MGYKAKIVIKGVPAGVLTNWPSDYMGLEALMRYARLRGFGDPESDSSALAQLLQVLGNCVSMPGDVSLGSADPSSDDVATVVVSGWRIADIRRMSPMSRPDDREIAETMVHIDSCQPSHQRLGEEFIFGISERAAVVFAGELSIGATIWDRDEGGRPVRATVVGFGEDGVPQVTTESDRQAHPAREHFSQFLGHPGMYATAEPAESLPAFAPAAGVVGDDIELVPVWEDDDDDVVPIAPQSEASATMLADRYEVDDLEREWQETLAWASGISASRDEGTVTDASDTGGISDTGMLRRLKQNTDDEYMMGSLGVTDTGILHAIDMGDAKDDDDELVVMLTDEDEEPASAVPDAGLRHDGVPHMGENPVSSSAEMAFADIDEPDMSDMLTDTGTFIVMQHVPAPDSTGEVVVVPTDIEGTVMTSSDEQATQPLPEQGIPFADVLPDETARSIVIPMEAPEIGPNLSTEETAKNPLPYPEILDAEFEPFAGDAAEGHTMTATCDLPGARVAAAG